MGDFFEDLGKRITETAGAVTKKTEEVVETQKIKSQIRVEERNKERDLQHLGKLVYDRFQKGEVIDTAFVELCEAVAQHEDAVQSYLKELAQLKGMELCKNCKGELESDMAYCPKCGTKVEEEIHFDTEETEEPAADEGADDSAMQTVEDTETVSEEEV